MMQRGVRMLAGQYFLSAGPASHQLALRTAESIGWTTTYRPQDALSPSCGVHCSPASSQLTHFSAGASAASFPQASSASAPLAEHPTTHTSGLSGASSEVAAVGCGAVSCLRTATSHAAVRHHIPRGGSCSARCMSASAVDSLADKPVAWSPAAAGDGVEDSAAVEAFRAASHFRRRVDGRVQLQRSDGSFMDVKLDAQVPGGLLLRDCKGHVYYLVNQSLPQIDLSSDEVVASAFGAAGAPWESALRPLQAYGVPSGQLVHVKMNAAEFRAAVSLLRQEKKK